jgi:hypothetical protein
LAESKIIEREEERPAAEEKKKENLSIILLLSQSIHKNQQMKRLLPSFQLARRQFINADPTQVWNHVLLYTDGACAG